MKKNNFLSGMGAKLALAVVALTTVTFTSCEKEDMDIVVKMNPAKVTLNTEVIYFNEQGVPATVNADVTYDGTTNNVIMGTEAEPAINKTVEVVATYQTKTASKSVKVEASANTTTTQNVTIFIVADESELAILEEAGEEITEIKWSTPANGHGINHNGAIWNENPHEYFVTIEATYPTFDSQTVTDEHLMEGADKVTAAKLDKIIEGLNWNKNGEAKASYTASAYSIFAAKLIKTTTQMTYTIVYTATNEEVAIVKADKVTSSKIEFEEDAHPSHAHDWSHGHGHGHGDASNAGGGIIIAD